MQCSNGMCRIWQHAACVGLKGSREEIEATVFFCARCQPAARALLAVGAELDDGFAPVAGVGADISPSEAATRAWQNVHGARDVGAAIAAALAGDRAAQLRAIIKHSRAGALRLALTHMNGLPLLSRAAEAGAIECTRLLLRSQSLPVPEGCLGTPVAAFCAALESRKLEVARALMQGVPGLLALAARPGAYEEGGTAVHAAAAGGCVDCLRLALPPGIGGRAAVTAEDSEGTTPLMLAAASSDGTPAVALLLSLLAGAPKEVSRVDAQGAPRVGSAIAHDGSDQPRRTRRSERVPLCRQLWPGCFGISAHRSVPVLCARPRHSRLDASSFGSGRGARRSHPSAAPQRCERYEQGSRRLGSADVC